ncbi:MAG: hypothetical protein MJB14_19680 [Spirochaetes bacterium]|nr:hypothetical protein [Spirochaetota bacterium]
MKVDYYHAKSLIRKGYANLFAWVDASFNPYQGCSHDCKYCDGKAEKYGLHADFGQRVRVKVNAVELLKTYLNKKGFSPDRANPESLTFFISSGACDPYQDVEKEAKITRQLLEVLYQYGMSAHILTKNTLALKDLDILEEMNQKHYAALNFSITLMDDKAQKIFEPGASSTLERLSAIAKVKSKNIPCGVYLCPALPFIGDTAENMLPIYQKSQEINADFVQAWGLTLKPGRNKEEFFKILAQHFPTKLPLYEQLYQNNHKYGQLDEKVYNQMQQIWPEQRGFVYSKQFNLGYAPKRHIPTGRHPFNMKAAEILHKATHCYLLLMQFNLQKKFSKSAYFIENHPHDLGKIDRSTAQKLPIARECHPYLSELFQKKTSLSLQQLEADTYQQLNQKIK